MKKRWNNIFEADGKAFILAMDHAAVTRAGQLKIKNPGEVIKQVIDGGADAVFTTCGVAAAYPDSFKNAGLLLRVDIGTTEKHPSGKFFQNVLETATVEEALKLGADGILCMGFTHQEEETEFLARISKFAAKCREWGVVLGVEVMPAGFPGGEEGLHTAEEIGFVARACVEQGADFIKAPFKGTVKEYKENVVDCCYRPILVLGGGESRTDEGLLQMVYDSVEAGCKGVMIGRAVFEHENITGITKAICGILHKGWNVKEALKTL